MRWNCLIYPFFLQPLFVQLFFVSIVFSFVFSFLSISPFCAQPTIYFSFIIALEKKTVCFLFLILFVWLSSIFKVFHQSYSSEISSINFYCIFHAIQTIMNNNAISGVCSTFFNCSFKKKWQISFEFEKKVFRITLSGVIKDFRKLCKKYIRLLKVK